MKIIKLFFALMGATLLSANALAGGSLYDENGFATNPENPNQYQEPTVTDGVYQIANAGNLYWFANFVNQGGDNAKANAVLANDITVNENLLSSLVKNKDGNVTNGSNFKQWIPIGNSDVYYTGTFDGKGHTISGLYFNDESTEYVGLFGYDESAKVQNVGVVDSYFKGCQYVCGVVGYNKGTVSNVYNTGAVSGETFVGGVVGYNDGGTVSNAYNTGSVNGTGGYVGGVVGANYGTVSNAYNTGSVSGSGDDVGGVVGYSYNGTVSNVYNTGSVRGTGIHVGGVVGANYGTVSNAYNTGSVSGSGDNVGGVVGDNDGGTVSNGFFNTAYYSGNAIGEREGTADNVKGLSITDLANLTVGNGGDFPLLEGETESPWVEGSGTPGVSNGKLVCKLPKLKIFESQPQPEVVLFNVQKGSDGKDYCKIVNADDLFKFAQLVNDGATGLNAKLTADICVNACGEGKKSLLEQVAELEAIGNLSSESFRPWTPIGTENQKFKGTFDGAGHTISGLYFNQDASNAGLFGRSTKGGSIKNVGVLDSYIKGKNNVGGIVGHNGNCTVSNVFSTSTVEGDDCVGGIAGYNDAGTIVNAYNMGAVSGNSKIAGIAGYNHGTTAHINNVYSSGTVSGPKGQYVRGLVGYNEYQNNIDKAYYNTDVFDGDAVGNVDGTNVEGMTTVELASATLPNGFSGDIWLAGSKDVVDGKLVYKFPGLKIFNSQPEVVLFNVQKGSDGKDYCEIANADDLFKFAQLVNDGATGLNAKLTADICVNGCGEGEKSLLEQVAELEAKDELSPESFQQWTPMSVPANVTVAFDGNGHTISGLYINKTSSLQGLFGQVIGNVTISNLGVVDFYVKGKSEVGSLAGQVTGKLNIENCFSAGYVEGETYVGGFVGLNKDNAELKIENSYNESSVNASSGAVGGLVGENCYASLTIANSYNVGTVTASNDIAGGLVGDNDSGTLNISNSYNVGPVTTSKDIAGGLVGGNEFGTLNVSNSYNVGTVTASDDNAGGLVGNNDKGTLNVSSSFFVATDKNGDKLGGEVKTPDEFANGEVTGLLNKNQSPAVWLQGKEYPILKDNHIHYSYENGFCVCGNYVQPIQDENGVYQISNAGELYWFADFVNHQGGDNAKANAILTNNIVVNTLVSKDGEIDTENKDYKEWTPIGYDYNYPYQGIFDGNGHTISGLYFNDSEEFYVGLFANNDGTIRNVGVVDSYFYGYQCVGGVCGNNNKGTISNCYNTSTVRGNNNIGGVSGFNFEGKIENCYNTGAVSGSFVVGEVCGGYDDNWATITNCYYLSDTDTGDGDGVNGKTAEQFVDGTVALLLHNYDNDEIDEYNVNGEIWGQNTSTDTVPNFSGKILFKVTLTAENGTAENGLGEYNKKYEIKATANTGYHFVEWSNGSTEIKDSILVVNDTALVATFEAHSFGNWDTTLVATCTVAGLRTHACACGEVETDTIAKLAHTVVVDSAKTATCTVAGLTEGKHCSVCDSVLVAQQTIPFGHKVVVDSAVAATCSATGLTEGKHCSVCDSIFVAQQTVAKIAHTVVVDSAKTATCTVAGLTEGKHCSVCDSVLVAQQTLPALGHKVETLAGVSPTCTADGLTDGSHCSVCGEVIKAQETIPALGHSFTNYIYNNDATTEADGTETAECDREGCNAIDVRTAEGTKLQTSVGTESAEGVVIYAHHNTIVVENATEDIYVYDATGRCVASRDAEFHVSIAMPREGIYIVRTGDKVQRVAVK